MVYRISTILSRFPENEKVVFALIHDSGEFSALCRAYADTEQELAQRTKFNKRDTMIDALQKRCTALEEEILTRIEGYRPS